MFRSLSIALRALERHPLRTSLTVLGISVGIAAVICIVTLGEGSRAQVQGLIEMGEDFIWIEAGDRNVGGVRTGARGARPLVIVGGVGIMNIMLVSVTERTYEVGLRMAVGATTGAIRQQFVTEAALFGCAGGVIGVFAGWSASALLASTYGWNASASAGTAVMAVAIAGGAAIVFGYYPAHRASMMDPVDALRAEM